MQKKFYEAPVAEQMEIRLEAGFLTISGGDSGASASKMDSDSWASWD